VNHYRRSLIIFAALSPFIGGAVVNIATSLVAIPKEAEIWTLVASALVVAGMVLIDSRQKVSEQREAEEREQQERERREQKEREEREERERRERKEQEERALLRPIRVPELGGKRGFRNQIGRRALDAPTYRAVEAALALMEEEFCAACAQYGMDASIGLFGSKGYWLNKAFKKCSDEIADLTGDGRWRMVGKNLKHLRLIGEGIYWVPGPGGSVGRYSLIPDNQSTDTFVEGVSVVVAQLRTLRAK